MRHTSVLFVGIGGGNDIFSTVLAMSALRDLGWTWERCAIAGVLSPFHDHLVLNSGEGCLRITTARSKRFIPTHGEPRREIQFVDAAVRRMAKEVLTTCDCVYGLDLIGGSEKLTDTFRSLSLRYDMTVLVDIGGDCLYHGPRDAHVLSPMFDAITLRAFVDAKVPGLLFLGGPGSDGELDPESIREAIFDTGAEPHALPAAAIDKMERLYREYIEPIRPGDTVPNTIKAYRSMEREITIWHGARAPVGRRATYVTQFAQRINTEMCRRFYLMDPCRIRNPFMVPCSNARDWFVKTQVKQGATNNEANLQSLRVNGDIWRFATPSPLFSKGFRRIMLDNMLDELRGGKDCDGLWFFPADWESFAPEKTLGLRSLPTDGLIAVRRDT